MRLLILFFLVVGAAQADISQYTLESQNTLPGAVEASDVFACNDGTIEGRCWVDDNTGLINFPSGKCYYGGDLEGGTNKQPGEVFIINEKQGGVAAIDLANGPVDGGVCNIIYRYKLNGVPTGSSGLEAIANDNMYLWSLSESGGLYRHIDTGQEVTPDLIANINNCPGCGGLGVLDNGNFVACSGPEQGVNGEAIEFYIDNNAVVEVARLALHQDNCEGAAQINGDLYFTGEPDREHIYSIDSVPRETETCDFSGQIEVYQDNGDIAEPQTVDLICPTVNATGTLQ